MADKEKDVVTLDEVLVHFSLMIGERDRGTQEVAAQLAIRGVQGAGNVVKALLCLVDKRSHETILEWTRRAREQLATVLDTCTAIEQHLKTGAAVQVGSVFIDRIDVRGSGDAN